MARFFTTCAVMVAALACHVKADVGLPPVLGPVIDEQELVADLSEYDRSPGTFLKVPPWVFPSHWVVESSSLVFQYKSRLTRRNMVDRPPDSLSTHPVWELFRLSRTLRGSSGNGFSGGLIVDKDPGEPLLNDYVGGYVAYRNLGHNNEKLGVQAFLGDVRWGTGTGLIFSRRSRLPWARVGGFSKERGMGGDLDSGQDGTSEESVFR